MATSSSSSSHSNLFNPNFTLSLLFFITIISHVNGCFTSIFNFGNSLSDTGNLLHLSSGTPPLFAFPPYGRTFFHRPTGRCCDGRLLIDFIAEGLGLPFLPPYFGEGRSENFEKGVNFAVVGATALDFAYLEEKGVHNDATNISLGVEMGIFKDALPSLCSSSSDCKELLQSSLIVMGEIGGNDYLSAFLQGKKVDEVGQLVPAVIQTIASAINELIELGSVTFLVPGVQPIGCMPILLTSFLGSDKEEYDHLGCLIWGNQFIEYHNELLQKELQQIPELHPNVNIIYGDCFNAAMRIYHSPKKYGYKETLKACCGKGGPYNYNASMSCGDPLVRTSCNDPSSFVSWDGIHYTEATYKLFFDFIFPTLNNLCPQSKVKSSVINRVLDS